MQRAKTMDTSRRFSQQGVCQGQGGGGFATTAKGPTAPLTCKPHLCSQHPNVKNGWVFCAHCAHKTCKTCICYSLQLKQSVVAWK